MSIAFGSLGVMSLPAPFALWSLGRILGLVELRSFVFGLGAFVVLLVLAYLTNPSETSFRQFLTEQSFRRHLSNLDDLDDQRSNHSDRQRSSRRGISSSPKSRGFHEISKPFHFSSRASVSLRTPKHVFHSFGIFTIAAVVPLGPRSRGRATTKPYSATNTDIDDTISSVLTDAWFVGAFGKWWFVAFMDKLRLGPMPLTKDEEGLSSGILEMKVLDCMGDFKDMLYASSTNKAVSNGRSDEIIHRNHRSSTPPPLPKSASLPLHTRRLPPSQPDHKQTKQRSPSPSPSLDARELGKPALPTPALSRSPSGVFEGSPIIAELLRQISASQASVQDLRGQLSDFQAAAQTTHLTLQKDLDSQRERKRADEQARAELKSRMKQLDDAKRTAESSKREAEKKLKVAQTAQANAQARIEHLNKDMARMHQTIVEANNRVVTSSTETSATEEQLLEQLEKKKGEIKATEDILIGLGQRARELEENIIGETATLRKAKEAAEMRRQDRSFSPLHVISQSPDIWPPMNQALCDSPQDQPPVLSLIPPVGTPGFALQPESPVQLEHVTSPRPRPLSLSSLPNYKTSLSQTSLPTVGSRSAMYPTFEVHKQAEDKYQLPVHQASTFTPFNEPQTSLLSPVSSNLIPSSLIQSLEMDSNGGPHDLIDLLQAPQDRRHTFHPAPLSIAQITEPSVYSSQPDSPLTNGTFDADSDHKLFGYEPHSRVSMEDQRASFPAPALRDVQMPAILLAPEAVSSDQSQATPRRWFSKQKKGLNPDAKEFSLSKDKERSLGFFRPTPDTTRTTFTPSLQSIKNAFTPHGSGPRLSGGIVEPDLPAVSFTPLFPNTHAFTPSAAEREALSRVLGAGSSTTSLERVSSRHGSDVGGSMPASPHQAHSLAHPHRQSDSLSLTDKTSGLFSSWRALPRLKTTFRPFADEDTPTSNIATAGTMKGYYDE